MSPLRALVGFDLPLSERLKILAAAKIALAWDEKEPSQWVYDKTSREKKLMCHLVRKDPHGKIIAEVKQVGGRIEWTATGMTTQVIGGTNFGAVRTAPTLFAAILSADSYLQGNDWEVCGMLILAPSRERDDEDEDEDP